MIDLDFPTISKEAFDGPLGDTVRLIEPHSESDPNAILLQLLVAFGNCAGRNAYYQVERSKHFPNIFLTLVGKSAKARKGTSLNNVIKGPMNAIAPEWVENCKKSGLASGEGLVWSVRDESQKILSNGEIQKEPGIEDKRLLVVEEEFSNVLRVGSRHGNTLSARLREAWDSGTFRGMTKGDPTIATNAHISFIGHITEFELKKQFSSVDISNGLGNRFLWAAVRRSKLLPDGGDLEAEDFKELYRWLAESLKKVDKPMRLTLDQDSKKLWREIYESMSQEHEGVVDALTSRGEAQIVRLALIFAVADKSDKIKLDNLKAAIAVWNFCLESVRYIWGSSEFDKLDYKVMNAISSCDSGLSRTDLHKVLQNNYKGERLNASLSKLLQKGKIKEVNETSGARLLVRYVKN